MLINVAGIFFSSINIWFSILYRVEIEDFASATIYSIVVLVRFVVLDAIGQVVERLKIKVHFHHESLSAKLTRKFMQIIHVKGQQHSPVSDEMQSAIRGKNNGPGNDKGFA